MAEVTLVAETGRTLGSSSSRRLRSAGKIPAVLYGHGMEPVSLAVDARQLRAALHGDAGVNTLLNLQLDGKSHLAMARHLQRDPVRNTVIHVDFQVVNRDEQMLVDVPLVLVGEARAVLNADGMVDQEIHALTVSTRPGNVPASIEIDISRLQIGNHIRVADVVLPEGVTTDLDPETAVVTAHSAAATTAADVAEIDAAAAADEGEAASDAPAEDGGAGEPGESADADGGAGGSADEG